MTTTKPAHAKGTKRLAPGPKGPAGKPAAGGGGFVKKGGSAATAGPPALGTKRPAPPAKPEEKAAQVKRVKRNQDLIMAITAKWERLRRSDTPTEERATLAEEVLTAAKGNVARLAMSHTASRVLQAAARHAPPGARAAAVEEVREEAVPLAKSSYGHFLVVKLIAGAPKEEVVDWLKLYRGHLAGLLRHPTGASVVDELYTRASPAQRDGMAAEFYSREYVLFPAGATSAAGTSSIPSSLAAALQDAPPPRRAAILTRLATQVTPILDKGMLDPALTHRLVAEYLAAAPPRAAADAIDALAGPALMRMVHTRDGAAAAAAVLALGTAKDRKKAVKAMKGHVGTMARDEWASGVLAGALTHTDDTQLLSKVIASELGVALDAGDAVTSILAHKHARRVLLQVLEPGAGRYLPPHTMRLVYPVTAAGEAAQRAAERAEKDGVVAEPEPAPAAAADEDSDAPAASPDAPPALGVSKKAGDKRRREVMGVGPASLGAKLLAAATTGASALLRCPGADVLVEAARGGGRDGVLLDAHGPAVEELRGVLVAEAAAPLPRDGEGEGEKPTHALTDFYASRALKHFALLAVDDGPAPAPGVDAARAGVRALWTDALSGRAAGLVKGHAAKVVAAVWVGLKADGNADSELAAAKAELGKAVGDVEAWAAGVLKKE